jgi:membrane protease YdiL (CAAX protease family)
MPDSVRDPLPWPRALAEVLLCSGYPTQLAIAVVLAAVGLGPARDGSMTPTFIFAISALDTLLLLTLVFAFIRASGDSARDLFFGARPLPPEVSFGLLTVPFVFALAVAVQLGVQLVAPSLRNVPVSPFDGLLRSPILLAGFVVLVVVAGGLREELQRAFLLNRFERRLGGAGVGVMVTSIGFGLGHTVQGWDAALITGLLGATWAVIYLRRRSVVSTVVSHALFNLGQIAAAYAAIRSLVPG